MGPTKEEINKAYPALRVHLAERYRKTIEWVKITISILTPSLVLLIGFQEEIHPKSNYLNHILMLTIAMMTSSILIGLLVLIGEVWGHSKAAKDIKQIVDIGGSIDDLPTSVNFGSLQNILIKIFPWLIFLSIIFLGLFGIGKYYK